jgi:DNA-binding transcriptional MocR family regulator
MMQVSDRLQERYDAFKITLAGAGLAMFAASKENVSWLLARFTPRTIGPDKLNQLRHVRFLQNEAGILQLMAKHRALIAPKFQKVLEIFEENLADVPNVTWTKPKGGYFISLDVPQGCAKRVVTLAKEAGVQLTPAGATVKIPTTVRFVSLLPFPD